MSNGHVCCILGVCCPPPGGRKAASKALAEEMAGYFSGKESYQQMAEWLLENFDLVPRGVGEAIVEAYRPEFAKLADKGAAAPAPRKKAT